MRLGATNSSLRPVPSGVAVLVRDRQPGDPITRPLPRIAQKRRFGGRGEIGLNADPGRREALLPLACPGPQSDALTGLSYGSSGLVPLHSSTNVPSPTCAGRKPENRSRARGCIELISWSRRCTLNQLLTFRFSFLKYFNDGVMVCSLCDVAIEKNLRGFKRVVILEDFQECVRESDLQTVQLESPEEDLPRSCWHPG